MATARDTAIPSSSCYSRTSSVSETPHILSRQVRLPTHIMRHTGAAWKKRPLGLAFSPGSEEEGSGNDLRTQTFCRGHVVPPDQSSLRMTGVLTI